MNIKYTSDPTAKALGDYHDASQTGLNWNGSMAGAVGADSWRKKQQEKSSSWSSSSNKTDSKVICTELRRQGLLDRDDYLRGARYVEAHLTERHIRGYHAWGVPAVRLMRRSKRATAFWRALAKARADHLAYLDGNTSRRNRFGALLCAIGHPVCYVIGSLIGEQDWHSLYADRVQRSPGS